MLNKFLSKIAKRFSQKVLQKTSDTFLADSLDTVIVSYKLKPKEKEIYHSEADVREHVDGYSDQQLNEYIIAKSKRWIENLEVANFTLSPHMYALLWVIQLVQGRIDKPLHIVDFGGGTPTIMVMLHQLCTVRHVDSYSIVESPTFVSKVPAEWQAICQYTDTYDGSACDLLILSGVLPYLTVDLVRSVYRNIKKAPPRFIYFGRTSFLREDYPADEAYTVQDSPFRDHGAQVDVGMEDIEANIAHYVKRHFKWSEVSKVLDPLGYRQVLELTDESGLENIKGLGLYSKNSLWELIP